MNIDRKVSFLVFLPSLSKYPEVELLDHRIVLIVIFEENLIAFSTGDSASKESTCNA